MIRKQHTSQDCSSLTGFNFLCSRQLCTKRQKQWRSKQASECILEFDFWISCESQLGNLLVTEEKMNSEGYFQKYFEILEFNPVILVSPIFKLLWVQKPSNEGNLTSYRLLHNAEYSEQERLFQVAKHRSLGKWSHLQIFWAPSPCVQHLFVSMEFSSNL